MTTSRSLAVGEIALARSVFGDAVDYGRVRLVRGKWWPFQPRGVVMAPTGNIHFHPGDPNWSEDFSDAPIGSQGLFIHEMTHVWQRQKGIYLPLARHPWCRYDYALKPGQRFEKYGIEQQAEIVRHAFLLREGYSVAGAPGLAQYESLIPFASART
jgi:hypothetical protein